jgi:quercetin dioxygenase-like cupin family protein
MSKETPDSGVAAPFTRRVLITAEDTDNRYALVTVTLPPFHPGTPLHAHPGNEECCYILEGTLAVTQGDHTITLTSKAAVHISTGVAHSIWNPTATPVTVLLIYTPGVAAATIDAVMVGMPGNAPGYEETS